MRHKSFMRSCIIIVILQITTLVCLISAQVSTGGTVQGAVVREGTGAGIDDVRITIIPIGQASPGQAETNPRGAVPGAVAGAGPRPIAARTDSSGRFSVSGVPAGTVRVRAELTGYFGRAIDGASLPAAAETLQVANGQIARVSLTMVPAASISGRVSGERGSVVGAAVFALLAGYFNGQTVFQVAGTNNTDDRGEYRIFGLPPAEYLVMAVPRSRPQAVTGSNSEQLLRTFYPSAVEPDRAISLSLRGGDDLGRVDVRLATGANWSVRGRVTNTLPPGPIVRSQDTVVGRAGSVRPSVADLLLVPRDAVKILGEDVAPTGETRIGTANNSDGSFELRGVAPGAYDLVARLPAAEGWGENNPPGLAKGPWAFGVTPIDVRNGDVDGVAVMVHKGVDLKGQIFVNGKGAALAAQIFVQPLDLPSAASPWKNVLNQIARYQAPIQPNGAFTIPLLPQGRYRFRVVLAGSTSGPPNAAGQQNETRQGVPSAAPQNSYVEDIRQGPDSVFDEPLIVGTAPLAPVDLLVNTNAGRVEGTVFDKSGKPAANITVVLVPPQARRKNPLLYKPTRTDARGNFTIGTVAPGNYKLFAWESIAPDAYLNPEVLKAYENQGASIAVPANGRISQNINLITRP